MFSRCRLHSASPSRRSLASSEAGVAFVELALITPLLILSVSAVVDFGLELREYTIVVEAARVGARASGMLPPGTPAATVTQTAVSAASAHLQNSGYAATDFRFLVEPTHLDMTFTGRMDRIRLNVQRRSDVVRHGLISGKKIDADVVAEFSLAAGNTAQSRT